MVRRRSRRHRAARCGPFVSLRLPAALPSRPCVPSLRSGPPMPACSWASRPSQRWGYPTLRCSPSFRTKHRRLSSPLTPPSSSFPVIPSERAQRAIEGISWTKEVIPSLCMGGIGRDRPLAVRSRVGFVGTARRPVPPRLLAPASRENDPARSRWVLLGAARPCAGIRPQAAVAARRGGGGPSPRFGAAPDPVSRRARARGPTLGGPRARSPALVPSAALDGMVPHLGPAPLPPRRRARNVGRASMAEGIVPVDGRILVTWPPRVFMIEVRSDAAEVMGARLLRRHCPGKRGGLGMILRVAMGARSLWEHCTGGCCER